MTERTKKKKEKPVNYWKYAFLSLLGILVGLSLFLFIRISTPREKNYENQVAQKVASNNPTTLEIKVTKEQTNHIIAHYLNDYLAKTGGEFDFYLEDQALLKGKFKLFEYPLDFYLYFTPYVMENGNIQLKAQSLSLGILSLPLKEILKYIEKHLPLPAWVEVVRESESLIIHLNQLELRKNVFLKAEKIDLLNNDIRFSLITPLNQGEETDKGGSQE